MLAFLLFWWPFYLLLNNIACIRDIFTFFWKQYRFKLILSVFQILVLSMTYLDPLSSNVVIFSFFNQNLGKNKPHWCCFDYLFMSIGRITTGCWRHWRQTVEVKQDGTWVRHKSMCASIVEVTGDKNAAFPNGENKQNNAHN